MHAVVVEVQLNEVDEARKQLAERVVPGVRQLPGVQAGYWLAPQGDQGFSIVLFDNEQNARSAADTVQSRVPPSVTVKSVEVREVIEQV